MALESYFQASNHEKLAPFAALRRHFILLLKAGAMVVAVFATRPNLMQLAGLLWLMWLIPAAASGHAKSVSYSNWRLGEDQLNVSVRVPLLELSRLGIPLPFSGGRADAAATDGIGQYLAEHLKATTPAGPCQATGPPRSRPTEKGWVLFRWSLVCPEKTAPTIESSILTEQAPSHLHFARATLPASPDGPEDRPRIVERVLTSGDPTWPLLGLAHRDGDGPVPEPGTTRGTSVGTYLGLGIEHILSGWDHLAFVLALVLLARSFGEVAKLVTGFTVAHSLTLGLAVLGWLQPEPVPIEAVIAFSVALIAAENAWMLGGRGPSVPVVVTVSLLVLASLSFVGVGHLSVLTLLGLAVFSMGHFGLLRRATHPGLHRVVLAFAFGLVHGFGFAGVLAELTLPAHRLAAALLGFNLGVELGQLAVVALIWPGLVLLRRSRGGLPHRVFAEVASAAICSLGLYWFLTRTFGAT